MKGFQVAIAFVLILSGCRATGHLANSSSKSLLCADAIAYSDQHHGLSVLMVKGGEVVCSSGGASVTTPYELWSGTKSFVGIMAAAAVQDGLLTLDEHAADTLQEWRDDPLMRQITIRQILSMTDGQASKIGAPPGYADAILIPATSKPGAMFQYGPAPMQVFGEIMKRKLVASGQDADVLTYLDRRILAPLSIRKYQWRRDPIGDAFLPQGAILSAHDWSKFGLLVLNRGKVHGAAIVDEESFSELFAGSRANPAYGLTWWLSKPTPVLDQATAAIDILNNDPLWSGDIVFAAGAGDQRLYVVPSKNLVIVRQAKLDLQFLAANDWRSGWSDETFLRLALSGR